ncbi:hypothetical protein ACWDKQ_02620 [Saccharopolyspora sp. NPDC000995]
MRRSATRLGDGVWHVVLASTINVHRSPFGGRHFENFSQEPLLIAEIGPEVLAGIQSRGARSRKKFSTTRSCGCCDRQIG